MEFRALSLFTAVVRQGGFSAAAKGLGLTQPTLTKAVQQLEHECGGPLLDRSNRKIRLTSAGELVYERAKVILQEHQRLEDDLASIRGLKRGRLRLGLPSLGSSLLFAPHVADFRRQYPGIEITLQEQGSLPLQEGVRSGEIEVGVSLGPVPEEFAWQPVCDEPLVALLPADHPLHGHPSVTLADLQATPFILFDPGFSLNAVILDACQRRGFVPLEAARSGHVDFIIALVAAGLGVALLPRLIVAARPQDVCAVVPVADSDLRWNIGLIWRREATLSPAASRWLEVVRSGSGR
jgi:DNA-binding transcriptional LysR family regulator